MAREVNKNENTQNNIEKNKYVDKGEAKNIIFNPRIVMVGMMVMVSLVISTQSVSIANSSSSNRNVVSKVEYNKEVVQAKAAQLSKELNSEFIADENSYVSTIFYNTEGSVKLSFEIDDNGGIVYSTIKLLNMKNNKELNEKAKEYITYAIGLSNCKKEISENISEYLEKISSDNFLGSQEYKTCLEKQEFYHYFDFNEHKSYIDITTLDPHVPGRSLSISMLY